MTNPKTKLNPGTLLSPVPAVLVSCRSGAHKPNIISLAWVGTVCSEPPVIAIGVRPSRHSYDLIKNGGDFVVNLPTAAQAPAVDFCGTRSGREIDKFAAMGFDAVDADHVASPLIAQCPVNLECKVLQTISLGSHDVFLGEVVAAHADPAVLTENGGIDAVKAGLIAYAGGRYWSLHRPVERKF